MSLCIKLNFLKTVHTLVMTSGVRVGEFWFWFWFCSGDKLTLHVLVARWFWDFCPIISLIRLFNKGFT